MQAEITYNWDDIEVGRFDLNHSENFFTQKHFKHEKFSEEFHLIQAMATSNLNESFSNAIAIGSSDDKENNKPTVNQPEKQIVIKSVLLEAQNGEPTSVKEEKLVKKSPPSNIISTSTTQVQSDSSPENPETEIKKSTSLTTSNGNRRPANLLTRPRTPQLHGKSNSGPAPSNKNGKPLPKAEPPHAYEFQEIYQKKKEEAMRKLLEEEKKNRVFHSRPVPKSVVAPRSMLSRKDVICGHVTVAKTPVVLKNSREADERRKQRMEEWKRKNAPLKFTSREAAVLQKEPFEPKKSGQTVQMQPFNLHTERRLGERKQYDEQQKRTAEEKKKQEEDERKKREEELVKELRKLASFKARPNPFK